MDRDKRENTAALLDTALDAVLAAAILVGDGCVLQHIPDEALDVALATDARVQEARGDVQRAMQAARERGVEGDAFLAIEESGNALAARCAEVGFRLGVRLGRDSR